MLDPFCEFVYGDAKELTVDRIRSHIIWSRHGSEPSATRARCGMVCKVRGGFRAKLHSAVDLIPVPALVLERVGILGERHGLLMIDTSRCTIFSVELAGF